MSVTLIVSVVAIVVAAAALVNQFRPKRPVPSTQSPQPIQPPPAPQPPAELVQPEPAAATAEQPASSLPRILVDTSAIIDGRIADIATAGFIPGRLAVPRFVLAELQNIADSEDAMRRGRGRRGLDVLNTLRELPDVEVEIIEDDVPKIREVDAKLVALAQKFGCNVLTTDYNLNRVAQIQGVRVLNVNELSNAIRPVVLPGEELVVRVVQPGKERHQGVGYLADGTMIVVENGDKLIGQEVATEVTRVFQTVAGKMIFAVPRNATPVAQAPITPLPSTPPTQAPVAPAQPATPAPKPVQHADRQVSDRQPADRSGRPAHHRGPNRPNTAGNAVNAGNSQAAIENRLIAATNAEEANSPRRPNASSDGSPNGRNNQRPHYPQRPAKSTD